MQIERHTAGEYSVTDGQKLISLKKGLNRKWTVEPIIGCDAPARTVRSYGDAKLVAQDMLAGKSQAVPVPAAKASAVEKRARTALKRAEVETIRDRETLAARLRQVADELTNH